MNKNTQKSGTITRVIFDTHSIPENFSPSFNAQAMGLDIDALRKNPTVMDLTEGQSPPPCFDVPDGGAHAINLDGNFSLNARYIRDQDNPVICFTLKKIEADQDIEIHIKDMSLQKVAKAKLHGAHPAAFVASHFEGATIKANEMFYLKLAHEIDRNFTVLIQSELSKLMATQPDAPAQQAPVKDEPIFH